MNEYLKSAFTNISSSWSNSSTDNDHSTSNTDNAFVGQTVELEGQKLRVERVIAEGMPRILTYILRKPDDVERVTYD